MSLTNKQFPDFELDYSTLKRRIFLFLGLALLLAILSFVFNYFKTIQIHKSQALHRVQNELNAIEALENDFLIQAKNIKSDQNKAPEEAEEDGIILQTNYETLKPALVTYSSNLNSHLESMGQALKEKAPQVSKNNFEEVATEFKKKKSHNARVVSILMGHE